MTTKCESLATAADERIHEVRLADLKTGIQYFYFIESTTAGGQKLTSDVAKFTIHLDQGVPSAMVSVVNRSTLPTGRRISPVGDLITFSGRPVDIETSRDGKHVFIKDKSSLRAVDAVTFELVDSVTIKGGASLYGLASGNDGRVY